MPLMKKEQEYFKNKSYYINSYPEIVALIQVNNVIQKKLDNRFTTDI